MLTVFFVILLKENSVWDGHYFLKVMVFENSPSMPSLRYLELEGQVCPQKILSTIGQKINFFEV